MKDNQGDSVKVPQGARKQGKIKNYPAQLYLFDTRYLIQQDKFLTTYQLKYPALRDFITICNWFTDHNTGAGPNNILHAYQKSEGNYRAMYARLKVLKDKGLIYAQNCRYYPTDTAISELKSNYKSA